MLIHFNRSDPTVQEIQCFGVRVHGETKIRCMRVSVGIDWDTFAQACVMLKLCVLNYNILQKHENR